VPRLLIIAYLVTVALRVVLAALNLHYRHLHRHTVPPEFAHGIEPKVLLQSSRYNAEREGLGLFQLLFSALVVVTFLFAGGLATYDRWILALIDSRLLQGVAFFAGLQLASSLLELPFDAIATFRIEQRHGFNRTPLRLFIADWLKSTLLGMVLVVGASAAGLSLLDAAPQWYWFWFWVFGVVFAVVLMLIAPYVIEPLFIKTSPLANVELAAAVQQLADRVGVKVTQVLEVDASRRSAHSNAYFTGIGRVKRVVLFDTLLERLSAVEVLAVLGHELGHWKLRHVTKRLASVALFGLLCLYAASRLLQWAEFPAWVGLAHPSVPAELVMLAFLANILGFIVTPLSAFWSRCHEWQADAFAKRLVGDPSDLASALVKLARDNLTNLHPHPAYAAFYHSHPSTPERVRRLLARTT
jgi:STE24 endopeptidase